MGREAEPHKVLPSLSGVEGLRGWPGNIESVALLGEHVDPDASSLPTPAETFDSQQNTENDKQTASRTRLGLFVDARGHVRLYPPNKIRRHFRDVRTRWSPTMFSRSRQKRKYLTFDFFHRYGSSIYALTVSIQ